MENAKLLVTKKFLGIIWDAQQEEPSVTLTKNRDIKYLLLIVRSLSLSIQFDSI